VICDNPRMPGMDDEAFFNDQYCARLRRLRDDLGWTAEQMAVRLGIPADRYRKYEVRSPMPPYLIPRFAAVVNRSVAFVLTGADEVSSRPPFEVRRRA
jgi:transcriptional regulator with XRE-family HTH domain